MAYSDFKTFKQLEDLGISHQSDKSLFDDVEPIAPSDWLKEALKRGKNRALSTNTEKARSELIISPITDEVVYIKHTSCFSGIDFDIDKDKGLNGFCDFILSQSANQGDLSSPIICVVEAKNENIKAARPQCIAEMEAARLFNGDNRPILGAVTTGDTWLFMLLKARVAQIDTVYYQIANVDKILGILCSVFDQ